MTQSINSTKGSAFEKKVASLFALLGYTVQHDVLIAGRQVDLFLEDQSGPLVRKYIVECKDQAVSVSAEQYDSFRGRLATAKNARDPKLRGIIVCSVGFTKQVKAQSIYDDIELISISELEQSVIDFRQYVQELVQNLEQDPALDYFVEPNLLREHLTVPQPAYEVLEQWLADPSTNQLTLLGDYGTGKTTLLKHVALRLAKRYQQQVLEEGARGRVPIYVDLREYTQAISLKQIILSLLDTYGIRTASYAAFEYVSRDGQILLILDGFDEMASRGNYEITLRNFRELNRGALGRAKIILSCRTHYFTTNQDMHRFLGNPSLNSALPQSYTDLYREIATKQNFLITYLVEFEPTQVDQYLKNRCGENAGRVSSFIQNTYNLAELSRRPVLLEMIVSSEGSLHQSTRVITPGILYQVYTDIWLSRNDWSSRLDIETKTHLLERFANLAQSNRDFQLNYEKILHMVGTWRTDLTKENAIEIDRELRTATFLVRDQEGNYQFSHKSFQEFFLARYLLSEASQGRQEAWGKSFFSTEVYRFVRDLLTGNSRALEYLLVWIKDDKSNVFVRSNSIKCVTAIMDQRIPEVLTQAIQQAQSAQVRAYAATGLGVYTTPEAIPALLNAVQNDTSTHVRTNALAALARYADPDVTSFVITVLDNHRNQPGSKSRNLFNVHSLYIAAHQFPNQQVIDACIRNARNSLRDNLRMVMACLELCKEKWSLEAEQYCLHIIKQTHRPKAAAIAFSLLSLDMKLPLIDHMLKLIQSEPGHPHVSLMVHMLKGIRDIRIENWLVEQINNPESHLAEAAFTTLVADYPNTAFQHSVEWMQPGRPHTFRGLVAREYAVRAGANGARALRGLLHAKERPRLKLVALQLLYTHCPDIFGDAVVDLWSSEPATIVKRIAIELLMRINRKKALSLILTQGLTDSRTGVRVAMCSILGSEGSKAATKALLEMLEKDDSHWVRLQALRSLASPGKKVSKASILEASAKEQNQDVLNVRRQILDS